MAEVKLAGCSQKREPLIIFYDSEAARGSVYYGDIIEIGAKCHPDIVDGSFQTFINTKQDFCAFGENLRHTHLPSPFGRRAP